MSYMKGLGTSAKGNDRLLKQYGGNAGSSPMARQHYATGGAVKGGNPSLDEGLSAAADGAPAKRSLARPGRKVAGKKKDAKTNINIIVAGAPGKADGPGAPPMPAPGPMAGPPPPMPPPGGPPGGPPMPLRANGGRVAGVAQFAKGGKVKSFVPFGKKTTKADEASKIAKKETDGAAPFATGGKVKRAEGGSVHGLKNEDGGAMSGSGRLAKIKMYGK